MAITLEPMPTRTTTKKTRDEAALAAADKIKPVKDVDKHFKFCLYGRNKVGKTDFACSSTKRTLLIDCNERGFDSVADRENVDVYLVERWEDLDPIFWLLKRGNHPYEVVVIDTITMLASVGMKWVLKDEFDRDMNKDPNTPDRRAYLKLGEMLKDAIIKFRNLPVHVIFLAQEKVSNEEDEEGNVLSETHPELSPGPRSVLLSATNIIGRIYVREVEKEVKGVTKKVMERRMLLGSAPKIVSGNRFKQLRPIEVIKPDGRALQGFLDRVYGEPASADTQ